MLQKKMELLSQSVFALAFENSAYPGYVTEKAVDAIVTGAVPVVWGGAQYSSIFPRRPNDVDGSHPVFIDAASFHSPEDLGDYLAWLEETGNVQHYRPWLRSDVAIPRANAATTAEIGKWPCDEADVVRCGFGHFPPRFYHSAIDKHLFEVWQGNKVPDEEVEDWFVQAKERITGALTTSGLDAVVGVVGNKSVGELAAPWRHPLADPTLREWRLQREKFEGKPVTLGLGPDEIVMSPGFCNCGAKGEAAWCGMPGSVRRSFRDGDSARMYVGDLPQRVGRQQGRGFNYHLWPSTFKSYQRWGGNRTPSPFASLVGHRTTPPSTINDLVYGFFGARESVLRASH